MQANVSEQLRMSAAPILVMNSEMGPSMQFYFAVAPEQDEAVQASSNKSFGMLIAPVDYFAAVSNEVSAHGKTWHEAFAEAGINPKITDDLDLYEEKDEAGKLLYYRIRYDFGQILFNNTNREFSAIGYVKTVNGDKIEYTYAVFENENTVITSARSIAYLTAGALDAAAAVGEKLPTETETALRNVLIASTYKSLGSAAVGDEGYTYSLMFAPKQGNVTLSKGSSLKLTEVYTPSSNIAFSQIWTSSDSSVATVSRDGLIKAIAPGNAKIMLYSAGATAVISVTVE